MRSKDTSLLKNLYYSLHNVSKFSSLIHSKDCLKSKSNIHIEVFALYDRIFFKIFLLDDGIIIILSIFLLLNTFKHISLHGRLHFFSLAWQVPSLETEPKMVLVWSFSIYCMCDMDILYPRFEVLIEKRIRKREN